MENAPLHDRDLPILFGCPFMATTNTIIDGKDDKLTMTVLDETVEYKVFDYMSYPSNSFECFTVDALDGKMRVTWMSSRMTSMSMRTFIRKGPGSIMIQLFLSTSILLW